MHEVIFMNVLAALVLTWAWTRLEMSPTCIECSGKLRHRPDCPSQK